MVIYLAKESFCDNVVPLAHGIVERHKSKSPAGESPFVFCGSAFANDVSRTNLRATQAGKRPECLEGTLGPMYLMYVDESGDSGMPANGSPTRYFCLSGIVVHELRWLDTIHELLKFRRWLRQRYGVYLEAELHAGEMIGKPKLLHPTLQRLKKYQRLAIIRQLADKLATLSDIRIINVVVDKHSRVPSKDEVFRWAWYSLFQRFENTIHRRNFPGPNSQHERGIIFPDNTDGGKLKRFLTEMRNHNPLKIPQGRHHIVVNQPLQVLIEDPVMRDSRESYLIQAADCAAFLLKQSIAPSSYMRKHGGNAYFKRLTPVLCLHASMKDPLGIVRL